MKTTAIILVILLILIPFLPKPVEVCDYTDYGTLTAAEQGVFRDILTAVENGETTVEISGIISHERILTHLGMYYGEINDLLELYRYEDGCLLLNLERFHRMEQNKIRMDSLVDEALNHIHEGSDRYKLFQIARYIARNRRYIEDEYMCGDYSVLFYKMASRVGIQAYICFGDAGGFHAWNMVKINDNNYYYDITWYDTTIRSFWYLHNNEPWGRFGVINDKWAGSNTINNKTDKENQK